MTAPGADPGTAALAVEPVLVAWRRLAHVIRIRERLAERESGLTGAQLFALRQLASDPGLSLGELARRTATHASSISVVVTRLIDKGLARRDRDPADRRRLLIHPTEAGIARLERAPASADMLLVDSLAAFDEADRRRLAHQLDALATAVAGSPD